MAEEVSTILIDEVVAILIDEVVAIFIHIKMMPPQPVQY